MCVGQLTCTGLPKYLWVAKLLSCTNLCVLPSRIMHIHKTAICKNFIIYIYIYIYIHIIYVYYVLNNIRHINVCANNGLNHQREVADNSLLPLITLLIHLHEVTLRALICGHIDTDLEKRSTSWQSRRKVAWDRGKLMTNGWPINSGMRRHIGLWRGQSSFWHCL